MSKRKYYALVYHDTGWKHYAIHEALMDTDDNEPYWVGSKAIKQFADYESAIVYWGMIEPKSGTVDILNASEIQGLMDKVDYGDEDDELRFD